MAIHNNIVFCTYFDSNFLLRGLALHSSLIKHNPKSRLFILACDVKSYELLIALKLQNTKIINLPELEDKSLLSVKNKRSRAEYLWTITPYLPLYVLKNNKACKYVCYIDADTFFFNSVEPVFKEMGQNSIYITRHNYPKGTEIREHESGIFNVGFNLFKNDSTTFRCLRDWRASCLNWCYAKREEGKFGDQMYLNEWPEKYSGVMVSKNVGVNTAPWNISQYKVQKKRNDVYINNTRLIFYHFHQLYFENASKSVYSRGYNISKASVLNIYNPYIKEIKNQFRKVKRIDPSYKFPITRLPLPVQIRDLTVRTFGYPYWRGKTFLWKKGLI